MNNSLRDLEARIELRKKGSIAEMAPDIHGSFLLRAWVCAFLTLS